MQWSRVAIAHLASGKDGAWFELGASIVGFVPGGDIAKGIAKGVTKGATKTATRIGAEVADDLARVIKGSTATAADGLSGARKGAAHVHAPRGPPRDGVGEGLQARFIGQPDGRVVDTHSTPRGSYEQPNGGRTDILQAEDHGAGLSHTHDPNINKNPKTGKTFVNGRQQPGRPVSIEDVLNIRSGAAVPSLPKGR